MFDLGYNGHGMSRVAQMSTDGYMIQRACQVVGTPDKKLFTPIVHIAPITNTESYTLHLVAITQAGTCVCNMYCHECMCVVYVHVYCVTCNKKL